MNDSLDRKVAAQVRELRDPAEKQRPLPWFVIMVIGAMAMWGGFSTSMI